MRAHDDRVRSGCRVPADARRREGRGTLRDDVNRLIRLGLAQESHREEVPRARFSTPTFDSGPALAAIDDVEAALARAEGEDHR
jgi:hypothetical protein